MTARTELIETLKLIAPMRANNFPKLRVGRAGDGGYVMVDDFCPDQIAISCGIGSDVSWDLQVANTCEKVLQFDHTVYGPPTNHRKFEFQKVMIGVGWMPNASVTNLSKIIQGQNQCSRFILKLDIEGSEWACLSACPPEIFLKCDQMVIEFHALNRLALDSFLMRAKHLFARLHRSHQVVHVHGNNWSPYHIIFGIPIPDVLEITFASRQRYDFSETTEIFPTNLDFPCKPNFDDWFLGRFVFA